MLVMSAINSHILKYLKQYEYEMSGWKKWKNLIIIPNLLENIEDKKLKKMLLLL